MSVCSPHRDANGAQTPSYPQDCPIGCLHVDRSCDARARGTNRTPLRTRTYARASAVYRLRKDSGNHRSLTERERATDHRVGERPPDTMTRPPYQGDGQTLGRGTHCVRLLFANAHELTIADHAPTSSQLFECEVCRRRRSSTQGRQSSRLQPECQAGMPQRFVQSQLEFHA